MTELKELKMRSFVADLETARAHLSELSRILASLPEESHLESLTLDLELVDCSDHTAFVDLDRELCRASRYEHCKVHIILSNSILGDDWNTEDSSSVIASFTSQLASAQLPDIYFTTPSYGIN
jgi:hypothetical protein